MGQSRILYLEVKSKDVVIHGPKQFAEVADANLPSINVIFMQDTKSEYEGECRKNAVPVPGTLKVNKTVREAIPTGYKLTFLDNSGREGQKLMGKNMHAAIYPSI